MIQPDNVHIIFEHLQAEVTEETCLNMLEPVFEPFNLSVQALIQLNIYQSDKRKKIINSIFSGTKYEL